jgi:hypothetical protein
MNPGRKAPTFRRSFLPRPSRQKSKACMKTRVQEMKWGCNCYNGEESVNAFCPVLFITFRIRISVPSFSCAAYLFTLKEKAAGSSETLLYSY